MRTRRSTQQDALGASAPSSRAADPAVVQQQVLTKIEEAAADAGFELADSQRVAAQRLAELASAMADGWLPPEQQGLYLWGPVGRGKTWLLDRFFEAAPEPSRIRYHFQRFFRDFHGAMAGRPVGRAAIADALERTIGGTGLLCFDEFYAHEAGDATLLTRLLEEILIRRIPLIITSNYPPDGLLPDAEMWTSDGPVEVSQRPFKRGIELIERSLAVLAIDDGVDYRGSAVRLLGDKGFRSGRYVGPGTLLQLSSLIGVTGHAPQPPVLGLSGGRRTTPLAVHDRQIAFTFPELCERPISAGDVLGLASRYRTWTVTGVPRLGDTTPEAAQRFVNLVDVLHDADVCLNIVSDHTLADVVAGDRLPPDIRRAASRLSLLR